jgi:hypothetical protein
MEDLEEEENKNNENDRENEEIDLGDRNLDD